MITRAWSGKYEEERKEVKLFEDLELFCISDIRARAHLPHSFTLALFRHRR